jgi:hypothetical protein
MIQSKTCLLASIGTFCLFIKIVSNEKECKKNISELMLHFRNNTFLESNEKVQFITRISIQEPIPHFVNNMLVFGKNVVGSLNINVGPFLQFHPLHFCFSYSFQVTPKV